MELGNIIPLLVVAVIGGSFALGAWRKNKPVTVASVATTGTATTTPSADPSKKGEKKSLGDTIFKYYAIALGIMAAMPIIIPPSMIWEIIGSPYQTVATLMLLVGVGLFFLTSGKGFAIVTMMLLTAYLAFNKPEATADLIVTAKDQGVTTAIAKATPATPVPAQAVQMVIWEAGGEYELGTTPQSGVIPATGLVFQIPSSHCIGVTMESGLPATIIGLGKDGNGNRTQVIPNPADDSRKAKVRAKSC